MNEKLENKKVLILSCGTGGGHNSAAKAIQEQLQEKGITSDFIEYLEIINPKIKDKVNQLYIRSTKNNGKSFKKIYRLGELYQRTKLKSPIYRLNYLNRKKLYKYIQKNSYDYVVTTHLFAGQALTAIKKENKIKFMEVATDYVCIPFWEETEPDFFVIPSKELEKDFIAKGIKRESLLPLGIPVSNEYSKEYSKEEAKKTLNLKKSKNYILLLTGSMGFGNVMQMSEEIVEKVENIVLIVSCGNNKELFNKFNENNKNPERIIPISFTKDINLYMKASDIILTKPGGLTTTEIATLRKPFIHTMPIPGCENYNARFFEERKMSIRCDEMEDIVKNIKILAEDKKLQKEMIANQEKYIDKNACNKIVDKIIEELKK